jgi:hypothetical protein
MKAGTLGFGVLINLFKGNKETISALREAIGQKIVSITLEGRWDDEVSDLIRIVLDGGKTLRVWDAGQSCCESRYIVCDADLPSYVGQTIREFRQGEYETSQGDYDDHNTQAFLIDTTEGTIDFVTHVEHNGYYGGFSIEASIS